MGRSGCGAGCICETCFPSETLGPITRHSSKRELRKRIQVLEWAAQTRSLELLDAKDHRCALAAALLFGIQGQDRTVQVTGIPAMTQFAQWVVDTWQGLPRPEGPITREDQWQAEMDASIARERNEPRVVNQPQAVSLADAYPGQWARPSREKEPTNA